MTKANWELAPHDAETYEEINGERRFCKPGKYWSFFEWRNKSKPENWTILEHRPRIIAWEDMKEGMVVRCVEKSGSYSYSIGRDYTVGWDEHGDLGPIDDDGQAPPAYSGDLYTFELVSEPEQDPKNWDVLIDSPGSEGGEWTHVYGGDKCYIKVTEPDIYGHIVIVTQTDGYVSVCLDDVETIKPTITKAEAEAVSDFARYLGLSNHTFNEYIEKYNVK